MKKSHKDKCTRCDQPLNEKTTKWLELSNTDGNYYHQIPDGHDSQGGFPFGTKCATIELRETVKRLQEKIQ